MRLKITTLTGDRHELEVAPQDTVRDIKVSEQYLLKFDFAVSQTFCRFQDDIFVTVLYYLFYLYVDFQKQLYGSGKVTKQVRFASRADRP